MYFITNFLSTHYVHFYLISCFDDQCSDFIAYTSLSYVIKQICDNFFSVQKYEKLRNCLFKTKN